MLVSFFDEGAPLHPEKKEGSLLLKKKRITAALEQRKKIFSTTTSRNPVPLSPGSSPSGYRSPPPRDASNGWLQVPKRNSPAANDAQMKDSKASSDLRVEEEEENISNFSFLLLCFFDLSTPPSSAPSSFLLFSCSR